ncbi:MAG: YgiT-type zinc finger protein [SAR324 cluster bacterium]|nr:YgiT-type zinc finger protein [SAR324 cluster bacterium]
MNFVKYCTRCGGDVAEKEVREVLHGRVDTAFMKVNVGVCLKCGERFYTPDTVRKFENIQSKLEQHDFSGLQPLGQSYEVVA